MLIWNSCGLSQHDGAQKIHEAASRKRGQQELSNESTGAGRYECARLHSISVPTIKDMRQRKNLNRTLTFNQMIVSVSHMDVLITLNVTAQVLNVKPYRVIHLCEEGCVIPAEDSEGRGTVRRFNRDDLFRLAVGLELQNAGMTCVRIKKALRVFDWLPRAKSLAPVFRKQGLCGVIAALATPEHPAMLHVKAPERGVHPAELVMSFLQTNVPLPMPSESGLGTCRDTRGVDVWPVRVTLNLSFILSTIRLR